MDMPKKLAAGFIVVISVLVTVILVAAEGDTQIHAAIIAAAGTVLAAVVAAGVAAVVLVYQGVKALALHREQETFRIMQELRLPALCTLYEKLTRVYQAIEPKMIWVDLHVVQGDINKPEPQPREINQEAVRIFREFELTVNAIGPISVRPS